MKKFNTLYVSRWADGDSSDTRVIETPTYSLHSMVAGDDSSRIEDISEYCTVHEIHSVVLCPGFAHDMVAELARVLSGKAAVAVSRTDPEGGRITESVKKEARKGLKK